RQRRQRGRQRATQAHTPPFPEAAHRSSGPRDTLGLPRPRSPRVKARRRCATDLPSRTAPHTREPSRNLRLRSAIVSGLALLLLAAPASAGEDRSHLLLELESPSQGAVIGDPQGVAFVSGKAIALYGKYQTFDIVFVIDTSHSTAEPSGAD